MAGEQKSCKDRSELARTLPLLPLAAPGDLDSLGGVPLGAPETVWRARLSLGGSEGSGHRLSVCEAPWPSSVTGHLAAS